MANLYHNVASKDVLNSTEIKEDYEIVQQNAPATVQMELE